MKEEFVEYTERGVAIKQSFFEVLSWWLLVIFGVVFFLAGTHQVKIAYTIQESFYGILFAMLGMFLLLSWNITGTKELIIVTLAYAKEVAKELALRKEEERKKVRRHK